MNTRFLILLIALLNLISQAVAQPPTRIPGREDIVNVIYEFDLTADGKAHHIKVSKCEWQKDRSDASTVLTEKEKALGASIIAAHPYHPRPDQIGKKRYDFLLFDTKSRQFNRGTRPN